MKTTFIYSIADEFGTIRYIGKSNNPKNRLYKHILEKSNLHKYNWLKSIIKRGAFPIIEVVDEVPIEDWQFHEKYWISQFRCWGFELINLTEGGDGGGGYKHTEVSKKKMRKAKLGSKLPQEHKKKISDSVKRKFEESPNYNKCHDKVHILDKDELYQKYIIENLSMPKCADFFNVSERTIFGNLKDYGIKKDKSIWVKQCASKDRKVVYQYDIKGNFIKEFNGIEEAEKEIGVSNSSISKCCKGIFRMSHGYIWRFKDEFIPIKPIRREKYSDAVVQYDKNMKVIKEFKSVNDASNQLGVSRNYIKRMLKKSLKGDNFILKFKYQ